IYFDEKSEYLLEIKRGLTFSTHQGNIKLDEIIGQRFGAELKTHLNKPFYLLKPSIADLMMKVRRQTTIVYPKDAGMMVLKTAIGPGSKVIEIGTGSGALTLLLARMVQPDGKIYTYERRSEFIEVSKKNLTRCGLSDYVEFILSDVAKEGLKHKEVDAIFIDIPEPWTVIEPASIALAGGHHLVSLSPNIEQIKKTKEILEIKNFKRIETSEIMMREILIRHTGTRPRERSITHTAYLLFAQKTGIAP
ncbi:MAG: tRNA (adenine-N1)-methyltransferase, partial [candidate division WOR-3 bacterium]